MPLREEFILLTFPGEKGFVAPSGPPGEEPGFDQEAEVGVLRKHGQKPLMLPLWKRQGRAG
jgi:hypothetical protein